MNFRRVLADLARIIHGREECLNGKHCPDVETGGFGTGWGNPVNVGVANQPGVLNTLVRSDHVHGHPTGLPTPLVDVYANIPAAGVTDRLFWATDILTMFRDTGVAWQVVGQQFYARYINCCNQVGVAELGSRTLLALNDVCLTRIEVPFTLSIDRLFYTIGAAIQGNCRMGIYQEGTPATPAPDGGALLAESASVAQSAVRSNQFLTIAQTRLRAGAYWLGLQIDNVVGTFIFYRHQEATIGRLFTQAYGPFPNPCPATIAFTVPPMSGIRVASIP